jgi:hypothetical protein
MSLWQNRGMTATVGADIESICRKCGDVWHVIVAMIEDDIAKVQCKQCNGLHKYKDPSQAEAEAKKPAKKKRAPAMTAAQKKAAAAAKPKGRATVEPDLKKPTRPYKFSESYESGERVDHVKFGIGVVEDVLDGSKIEVYFPDGGRVLAVAKPASTLATLKAKRPAWLDDLSSAKQE